MKLRKKILNDLNTKLFNLKKELADTDENKRLVVEDLNAKLIEFENKNTSYFQEKEKLKEKLENMQKEFNTNVMKMIDVEYQNELLQLHVKKEQDEKSSLQAKIDELINVDIASLYISLKKFRTSQYRERRTH